MFNRIAKYDTLRQTLSVAEDLMRCGEFGAAEKLWSEVLDQNENCAQAYFERGRARALQATDAVGMLSDYQRATELRPNNPGYRFAFHLTLGGALQGAYLDGASLEVIEQAIDHYNVAIESAPESSEGYTYRGVAFLQLGEDVLAIQDFDEAIRLDQENALARLMRGGIYLDHEELASAKVDLEVALRFRSSLDAGYAELLDEWYASLTQTYSSGSGSAQI